MPVEAITEIYVLNAQIMDFVLFECSSAYSISRARAVTNTNTFVGNKSMSFDA